MEKFTNQFFTAIEKWSQQTDAPDDEIRRYVMGCIGRFDEEEDTERNLDLIKERLEMLVHDVHLSEGFLIKALIENIEDNFEYQLEDARKGENSRQVIRTRAVIRKFLEKATDQERQSSPFQKSLGQFEKFERGIFPTPEKIAERKLFLDVWREVTMPILRDINLDETETELCRQLQQLG